MRVRQTSNDRRVGIFRVEGKTHVNVWDHLSDKIRYFVVCWGLTRFTKDRRNSTWWTFIFSLRRHGMCAWWWWVMSREVTLEILLSSSWFVSYHLNEKSWDFLWKMFDNVWNVVFVYRNQTPILIWAPTIDSEYIFIC